ncbi:MAG: ATP-binding protein [Faecalibacterium sp.]|nr:ATP-binding protein [Faecalibacterium sp.]
MNIKRAKQEILRTVRAYLAKDDAGEYRIPAVRQRPILLMGPPGVGKTQIMEQAARESGIALVAYTITHHTRQSAVGLPFIRQKVYGDKEFSVTEYTMSEIIASIYEKMEATGLREGILFIDEINCVSETLAPTMLQFLQCKTFGNQAVPAGWLIVAAGNPPEYNKSVHEFDIVTLDRVRRMDIEPDLGVWKEYARAARLHPAVLSYLELHPAHFYRVNADVEGTQFVTARGWEDLSNLLSSYEALGLEADEELVAQYLQHKEVAAEFAAYLALYRRYQDDYGVEDILNGTVKPAVYARLMNAAFDERLSLVGLVLAGLDARFAAHAQLQTVTDLCYAVLKDYTKALTAPADCSAHALYEPLLSAFEAETTQKTSANLLDKSTLAARREAAALLRSWGAALKAQRPSPDTAFTVVKAGFDQLNTRRMAAEDTADAALEFAFDFMTQGFANGQELVVFITELTLRPLAHTFITENGCDRYFALSRDLLLDSRRDTLRRELAAEQARFGQL